LKRLERRPGAVDRFLSSRLLLFSTASTQRTAAYVHVAARPARGDRTSKVARACGNHGLNLKGMGRMEDAEAELRRALAIREKQLPPGDPFIARSLGNLGNLLKTNGKVSTTVVMMMRHTYGSCLFTTRSNSSDLVDEREKLDEAGPLIRRALAIREAALGPTHTACALSLTGLADVLRLRGDLDGAEAAVARALRIKEVGRDDRSVARKEVWLS
jgi:tetratricopeptide (TPR) repeat protein